MPDFTEQESFKVQWSHRQDSKANPYSSLSASVNFATSSYERNNLNSLYNPQTMTQSTRTSSVNWSTTFSSIGMSLQFHCQPLAEHARLFDSHDAARPQHQHLPILSIPQKEDGGRREMVREDSHELYGTYLQQHQYQGGQADAQFAHQGLAQRMAASDSGECYRSRSSSIINVNPIVQLHRPYVHQ